MFLYNQGLPKSKQEQKVAITGLNPLAAREYKLDIIGCQSLLDVFHFSSLDTVHFVQVRKKL